MTLICESMGSYCELDEFEINGVEADYRDFGDKYDHYKEGACDYGCGDMRFESKFPSKEVLATYNITESEYWEVCDRLEDELHFGDCGCCV